MTATTPNKFLTLNMKKLVFHVVSKIVENRINQ